MCMIGTWEWEIVLLHGLLVWRYLWDRGFGELEGLFQHWKDVFWSMCAPDERGVNDYEEGNLALLGTRCY